MKKKENTISSAIFRVMSITLLIVTSISIAFSLDKVEQGSQESIQLPAPRLDSNYSIEKALAARRSIRQYKDEPLTLPEVSQLLWSAQGVTLEERGYRTAPSAGATYPLHIYLISSNVTGLPAAFYYYQPHSHSLLKVTNEDKREVLAANGIRQGSFRNGACSIVIAAEFERTTGRYRDRGIRYVHNEVGHASQNIHLQAEALGLGTVILGSFDDDAVKKGLAMPESYIPLYIMPVGRK